MCKTATVLIKIRILAQVPTKTMPLHFLLLRNLIPILRIAVSITNKQISLCTVLTQVSCNNIKKFYTIIKANFLQQGLTVVQITDLLQVEISIAVTMQAVTKLRNRVTIPVLRLLAVPPQRLVVQIPQR